MHTIVVPLDGSPLAEHALPYARLLATVLSAQLLLLRAIPETVPRKHLLYEPLMSAESETALRMEYEAQQHMLQLHEQHAVRYLEGRAADLRQEGFDVTFEVRSGPPAEVIVETARAAGSFCIVMATHGYSGLRRWTLGSVTDKVSHMTETPLFLVRGNAPSSAPLALRHILVPLDGSALSEQALPLAARLALCARAEVTLLHALEPDLDPLLSVAPMGQSTAPINDTIRVWQERMNHKLAAHADTLRAQNVPVSILVEIGHPAEIIVDHADEQRADLIVMATHGYGGLRRWALGSTADKVLHATATPLLLIRAKGATT